ncbi:hypothetical protein MKW98_022737 [Papaver atlanticum]|uniref:Uncharacterized protein n=1 Tax=Papaver atlanticum TaxID=357466 RepID=A0AAD4TLW3_9MAGN|nr:hypothetical protein MKW98_022737 [Papaver atlanticum]
MKNYETLMDSDCTVPRSSLSCSSFIVNWSSVTENPPQVKKILKINRGNSFSIKDPWMKELKVSVSKLFDVIGGIMVRIQMEWLWLG